MHEYSYVWLYVGTMGTLHMAVDMSHAVDVWDRSIEPVRLQLRMYRALRKGDFCVECANTISDCN